MAGMDFGNSWKSDTNLTRHGVRSSLAVVAFTVLFVTGCAAPDGAVIDEEVIDEARGAYTTAELATVEDFLADDPRGPATELLPTKSGVLALFENGAASFGVDPVAEAWRYETPGPVHDATVSWSGESVLLRHAADLGPVPREQTVQLHASNGGVIESSTAWGETVSGEGHLMHEVWVAAESDGTLVARNLSDGEVAWERDLTETCSSGGVDDVGLAASGSRLLTSYACTDDDSAHAAMMGKTGVPFWEESWEETPVPQVHMVHEHTVPGGPGDPIVRMFNEGLSGGFLFTEANEIDGVNPFLPDPWHSAPGVGDYADEPLQNFETAPQEIVLHTSSQADMRDHLVLQATRWLAEDESVPFTKDDVHESLLIDGEFVQNPRQWSTGSSGYISALEEELEDAFP